MGTHIATDLPGDFVLDIEGMNKNYEPTDRAAVTELRDCNQITGKALVQSLDDSFKDLKA